MGDRHKSDLRVIWKYALSVLDGGGQHAIPEDSYLLDTQMQNGAIAMWWSVPQAAVSEPSAWPLRTFLIAGTGPPGYVGSLHYVGTVQDDAFVWHVLSHEPIPRDSLASGQGQGQQDDG